MERIERIIALRKEKKTYQSIADVFGITKEHIRQILKENAPELTSKEYTPRKPIRVFHCPICKTEFTSLIENRKYCSILCASIRKKKYDIGVSSYSKKYKVRLYYYLKKNNPEAFYKLFYLPRIRYKIKRQLRNKTKEQLIEKVNKEIQEKYNKIKIIKEI